MTPRKQALIDALSIIPDEWSLTPVKEKRAYRKGWQTEPPINRETLIQLIQTGDHQWSEKKQTYWTAFPDGYGIRTGNKLVAIDVDGAGAELILQAISNGNIPITVSWASGKPGRRQLLYKVSPEVQERLARIKFTHYALKEWGDLKADGNDQLDFRYDKCQSVIPPSKHPETGSYKWINSPSNCSVANAPKWLEEWLINYFEHRQAAKAIQGANKADYRYQSGNCLQAQYSERSDRDIALSCLDSIDPNSLDWHGWIGVILAARRSGLTLDEVLPWSRRSHYHTDEGFYRFWGSDIGDGAGLGSLINRAKENGWKYPQKTITREEYENRKILTQLERIYRKPLQQSTKTSKKSNQVTKEADQATAVNPCAIVPYNNKQNGWWKLRVTPETIPTSEEWVEMGRPTLVYQSYDRAEIIKRIIQLGYKYTLIADIVGAGKSTDVGKLLKNWGDLARVFVEEGDLMPWRAIYASQDYRNPSTSELEDIPEAVSGAGLVFDKTKLTPNGNPYRKRVSSKDKPDIEPLCPEDNHIQRLRAKGQTIGRGFNSPYCKKCPFFSGCQYLGAVEAQRKESVLRTHIDKISVQKDENVVVFIDEAGRAVQAIERLESSVDCLDKELETIRTQNPFFYSIVEPIFLPIYQGLKRAVEERGKFGLNHIELMKFLPSQRDLEEILITRFWNDWIRASDAFYTVYPSLNEIAIKAKDLLKPNLDELWISSPSSRGSVIDRTTTIQLLPKIIDVITGTYRNDISVTSNGNIRFTRYSTKHGEALKKAQKVFLMDATPDLIDLSKKLGVHSSEILQIECERPSFENLTIKVVKGLGKLGHQREHYHNGKQVYSPYSQLERSIKAVNAICEKVNGCKVGILDLKKYVDLYREMKPNLVLGHHFADNRNSNRFKECQQLISIGTPTENIGSALSEYHILWNESRDTDAFWCWLNQKATNELIQGIGRLRAHHRKNEGLVFWLLTEVSENQKNAIKEYYPGCVIQEIDVYDVCPAAASKGVQTERAIVEYLWRGVRTNTKTTINDVAAAARVNKSRVSQIVKEIDPDGFKSLKKSLVLLLEAINSKTKLFDLDNNLYWLASTYLPSLVEDLDSEDKGQDSAAVLTDFVGVSQVVSEKEFRQILSSLPIYIQVRLLDSFLHLTPDDFQDKLSRVQSQELELVA